MKITANELRKMIRMAKSEGVYYLRVGDVEAHLEPPKDELASRIGFQVDRDPDVYEADDRLARKSRRVPRPARPASTATPSSGRVSATKTRSKV